MEVANILKNKPQNKIYGLIGNINLTTNNENYAIIRSNRFSGTVKDYLNSPKDAASLKMVMLNNEYLTKTGEELSQSDLKKVSLAASLIENKEYLVLNYFEKGLNHKEKENFKRLFKKLSLEYNKTILIFTNDITFLWDIAEEVFIIDKNEVINTISKRNYFDIMEFIDKPEIVKFTNLMRNKNIEIENYKNTSDLLKAIYRIKGE